MGRELYIDMSHLAETIDIMKRAMSTTAFEEMMRRTFNDAGRKVKTIVKKEAQKQYEVKQEWVGSKVGWPKPQGAGHIGVVIPIKGARGSIGGTFALKNSPGRPAKGKKRRKINAKIVKGQTTTLPQTMAHQGGQPPFVANGVVFTRKYKGQPKPIVHVVGLGVPQMPLNRSEEGVQKEIQAVIENRLNHHFKTLFGK